MILSETQTKPLAMAVEVERLPLSRPFRISGHVFTHADVVIVTLSDGARTGRGEASGVYYLNDDTGVMTAALDTARSAIEGGITREQLLTTMPPCGARNAVDAALWELEARQTGTPVWTLAGMASPKPLLTTFTLGADDPETMALGAAAFAHARALKLKLAGDMDVDIARVRAVRAARPDCWIGVDANQGFKRAELDTLVDALLAADVKLLEQPLARGSEADLDGYDCPIPIAADESVLSLGDIPGLVGRFDVVNIKLDKCGGLTEGLAMARAARDHGLDVMVGNMVGSSLAMAPAFILGQLCDVVDLDGPIFLAEDRTPAITYDDGMAWCEEHIWGR